MNTRELGPLPPETADVLPEPPPLILGNWRGCMTPGENTELRNLEAELMQTTPEEYARILRRLTGLLDALDRLWQTTA